MQRIIECTVTDEYINGAGVAIGAAESHNDVVLRLKFSPLWEGLAKHVTFLDARGGSPTIVYLTADLIPAYDITVYDVPIPAEAKRYPGEIEMSVRGVTTETKNNETVVTRATMSAKATFTVLESVYDPDAETGSDPTATVAEQLQGQIDKVLGDINKAGQAADRAEAAANAAEKSETAAAESETKADKYWQYAEMAADAAITARKQAEAKAGEAASSATAAASAQTAAENAQAAAEAAEETCTTKAAEAAASAASAETAKTAAENARTAAEAAAKEAQTTVSTAADELKALTAADAATCTAKAAEAAASANEAALSAASAAADAETAEAAKEYVASKPIPTKTSELINDIGYVTAAEVPEGSTATTTVPKMDGTATVGTETAFARGDHIHPKDDTKVDKVTSAVSGNIAIFGADGALADGGLKFSIANGGLRVTYDDGL